ncbi:exonuclease domain-containing protein [Bradyrhizobium sp. CCBAU 53338]|uniref:exonuclease domain-containing protein n=1 Tax=Bradyrhizobium sp. CCBAU 53338 TaxID=1325111 RepID=UPI00188D714F|nr:exonuclease domain-containing protein [Bradyrhizobium sp. CCBAU 53338]QOZ53943.1 exonuclease [Bradyrhizobium sp. CCBAU 53338]
MTLPVLPVYYYHDHFTEMLSFVCETYGPVLAERHRTFIARFSSLSKDAQCLFIRMVNRNGTVFNPSTFKYAEIADPVGALGELGLAGYVRGLTDRDYAAFLACLAKPVLFDGARAAGMSDVRASWPKAKLTEYWLAHLSFGTAFRHCGGEAFIALGDTEPLEFLLYLYFGKTEDNLKNFALRDLGILRTNDQGDFSARFADAGEARACFHYARLLRHLETKSDEVYRNSVADILGGPVCPTDYAIELRSRAAHKAGLHFEKKGEAALAVQLYRAGASAECNERLARLLYAEGDKDSAEDLLRRMIDDPASDDEFVFASDFYARKFDRRRTGLCTELLRAGRTLRVDDTWRGNPEAGIAGVLRRQGLEVFHAENTLWHCLFGLLFWDELFESGQLHSGFDWMPHCLKDRTFALMFSPQIETKLEAVASRSAFPRILRIVAAKWGKPNGVFAWEHVDMDALRALLAGASADGLARILRLMCEDYRAMRDGFPDLMLVADGAVSFMEVKAEGDVIRRNQLTRLRQLGNAGILAEIGRADFRFDPEQDYVVVDIETTGGWTGGDRITEIGTVKIRNHEVVAEWHSLINPQRSIPSKIVALTGITNEMVRDAPLFAEVADGFMQFMGDGVFVAHNVNFDYGFIAAEYERLERRFRFPKLCTCAGMRRHYPGHKSYGLGKLTRAYNIELKDHHRALCDARAAAHLLNLINAKRDEHGGGAEEIAA